MIQIYCISLENEACLEKLKMDVV